MNFYNNYNQNIVKYDLLNKFHYTNVNQLPKFEKIVLNFGSKKTELKLLGSTLMALELITSQKGKTTNSSIPNISLKIKKGNPVGCKVTLRRTSMYSFLTKLNNEVFPKIKEFDGFRLAKLSSDFKTVSFKLTNCLFFPELESHYQYFNKLPSLDITIVSNVTKSQELYFLLKSFKFPIKE